jgi:hypothetical protein
MKIDIYTALQAVSNEDRMDIFRVINDTEGKILFNQILKKVYGDSEKSSSLSNHIGKLVDVGIIAKESDGYCTTPLGRELSQHLINIEKVFQNFNRELMVRTSQFCVEPFDETKIVDFLIREANMDKKSAEKIASITRKRLVSANIEYLTTPLIREYLNGILLENGYEKERHRLTRLGLPPYDIAGLLQFGEFPNIQTLFTELGKNVFEQFLLINQLPRGIADLYLSGQIFFLSPQSFGLIPSELVLCGEKLADIIINKVENISQKRTTTQLQPNEVIQRLSYSLREFIENVRQFFNSGLVITNFDSFIGNLCVFFAMNPEDMIKFIFTALQQANLTIANDPRCFHDENWELFIEIPINDINLDNQLSVSIKDLSDPAKAEQTKSFIIQLLISEYFTDCQSLFEIAGLDRSSPQYAKKITRITEKPTLLVNISNKIKENILNYTKISEMPEVLKQLFESSFFHNILFMNPCQGTKKDKSKKRILTPRLAPISIDVEQFAKQIIIPKPIIILDKIFINLPRLIKECDNLSDIPQSNPEIDLVATNGNSKSPPQGETKKVSPQIKNPDGKSSDVKPQDDPRIVKFYELLKQAVFNAMNMFDRKFVLISRNITLFKNWPLLSESLFGRDFLSEKKDLLEYNGSIKIVCPIALNGLIETVRYFTGLFPDQNKTSFTFLLNIISYVSDILRNNTRGQYVEYTLSQPQLDNYLQVRFIQDLNLLQNMYSSFFEVDQTILTSSFNNIKSLISKKMQEGRSDARNESKNYDITQYMEQQMDLNPTYVNPYLWSIFRMDAPRALEKRLDDFKLYQAQMGDGAFLDLFVKNPGNLSLTVDKLKIIQLIFQKELNSFSFTQILGGGKGSKYYRQNGCYKPLSYYERFLRNVINNRKDQII